MKKLMFVMLGLAFIGGSVVLADDATNTTKTVVKETVKKTVKPKKTVEKKTIEKKTVEEKKTT
ncbi:MAG: hypothetical protein ABSE42_16855 [Bryobacteraceae bacterium]